MTMLTKGAGKRRKVATAIAGAPPNAPPPAAETTAATEAPATSHSTAAATAKRKRAREVLSDAEEEGAETKDDAKRKRAREVLPDAEEEGAEEGAGSKGNHKAKHPQPNRNTSKDRQTRQSKAGKSKDLQRNYSKIERPTKKAKTRREQLAEVVNGEPDEDEDAEAADVADTDIDDDLSSEKDDDDEGCRL